MDLTCAHALLNLWNKLRQYDFKLAFYLQFCSKMKFCKPLVNATLLRTSLQNIWPYRRNLYPIRTHLAHIANAKKLCYIKQQSHSFERAR